MPDFLYIFVRSIMFNTSLYIERDIYIDMENKEPEKQTVAATNEIKKEEVKKEEPAKTEKAN